ncbi:MAG: hypothetical protein RR689_04475, partial [Mucinivorans sp.]
MKVRLNRKGILFVAFVVLVITIIVLAIVWGVRSCSSNPGSPADSTATGDTTGITYEEFGADSILMPGDTTVLVAPAASQNYLEKLVFGDMHKELYGISV